MIQILPEQFENILPLAVQWAEAKEKVILEHSTALSPQHMQDAKSVGVKDPERVRVYEVPQIPIPKHPILKAAAKATQLISPATIGISLGYGIYIHNNFADDRYPIVHELVHTMQCERFGGLYAFLEKYLWECNQIGYPEAPMEQEAIRFYWTGFDWNNVFLVGLCTLCHWLLFGLAVAEMACQTVRHVLQAPHCISILKFALRDGLKVPIRLTISRKLYFKMPLPVIIILKYKCLEKRTTA
jgi:hypothetical protein